MNISDNVEAEVIRQYELGYPLKMIEAYYAESRGILHTKAVHEVERIIYTHLLAQKHKEDRT